MKAVGDEAQRSSRFVIYTMALWMKCMLNFNNYQANMEQQKHINRVPNKSEPSQHPQQQQKKKVKIYRLILPHQLTVNRTHQIHAVHCGKGGGNALTKNDRRRSKHYTTQKKRKTDALVSVRSEVSEIKQQNGSLKDTFS